jgi:endonuclease G
VAREFGRRSGERYAFTSFAGSAMGASIDFLEEVDRDDRLEFRLSDILHIEDEAGPDVALLRVEPGPGGAGLAEPIPLSRLAAAPGQHVAVIGYPARDSRIPDYALMQSIFGDVYDRKRLAPGQIMDAGPHVVTHDCSTLGGNSGSVVLDLAEGGAVALHFAGRFLEANRAVPAAVIADRIAAVRRRGESAGIATGVLSSGSPVSSSPPPDESETFLEGVPADYVGRPGYDAAFIGVDVPLPVVLNDTDVLAFPWNDGMERVLPYQHFSVVMHRERRMCVFSATNIDGGRMRRIKRPGWRLDPRIPSAQQIRHECYGSAPRFSRGHMTRRTDPVWGDADDAARANADSMHVTNTVPQLQPFNAGIWLGLEDYALDHAVEDTMCISVFTGPFLLDDDPVRFGVRVPRSFWKVIAFIHDESRELSATGYVMSQEHLLAESEFVFGQHETWQVPLATIERRAGLSFAALTAADPLADVEEGTVAPLADFHQIAWRR